MNTVSAIKNPQHAAWYHEQADDYYAEEGKATSAWKGRLAIQIGNVGRVDRDVCASALAGRTPDGDYLGRWGQDANGETEWQHRPGYDATFSADKSVSILALVGGDDRLIQAHDEAVNEALDLVESRITTRIRQPDGSLIYENTGRMAAAVYRHETSRNQDAQLHSHSLIQNLTQSADGRWRSIESRSLYAAQKAAGEYYQQRLGQKARALGYTVEKVTTERGLNYARITDAPDDLIDLHSSRRKEIKAALEKAGLDEGATRSQRQTATLNTRKSKETTDHGELKKAWRQQAKDAGHDLDAIINHAKDSVRQIDQDQRENKQQNASEKAVDFAIEHLSERDARFTHDDLIMQATRYAIGTDATRDGIDTAIKAKQDNGDLIERKTTGRDPATLETRQLPGWTTTKGIAAEKAFLNIEKQGRGSLDPIMSESDARAAVEAASAASDHKFNKGQREATKGLLTSTNRITGIQGYAGSAKTSSVVSTYAAAAEANGYFVRGMAPTSQASEELKSAGITNTENTARLLARVQGQPTDIKSGEIWLVDEASMLSANDMRDLARAAENYDAKLTLVGDVQQLGSIQAGEPYRQLQNAGMKTYTLDEIVRQNNEPARQAVESSIDRDYQNALDAIDRSGRIVEHASDPDNDDRADARASAKAKRLESMATDYLNLDPGDRDKTLVIDPSREGRAALNKRIRDGLKSEGTIDRANEIRFTVLEKKDKTEAEARDYRTYETGDVVRFTRDRKRDGVQAGREYEVTGRDDLNEKVELRDRKTGESVNFAPNKTSPRRVQSYEESGIELAPGDRIRHTENDRERGHVNGQRGTVESVDEERGTATVKTDRGQTYELDARETGDKTIRHDYASTAHAAQGQTADRVIAHADTERQNLLDQRSFYVEVSRAKESISIYTDDRERLENALNARSGVKDTALDNEKEAEVEINEYNADTSADHEVSGGTGQGQKAAYQPETRLQKQQEKKHDNDHSLGM